MEHVRAERLVLTGIAGCPGGEQRDAAGFGQLAQCGPRRSVETTDQGHCAFIDQSGGVLADPQLQAETEKLRRARGLLGGQKGSTGGKLAVGSACGQDLAEEAPTRPELVERQTRGGGCQKKDAAGHHRNVYRYAAMCRASMSLTPVLGMAVPRSMLCGSRIQRSMLSGVLGSWPPR